MEETTGKSGLSTGAIVGIAVIVAIIFAGGAYAIANSRATKEKNDLNAQITELQNQVASGTTAIATASTTASSSTSATDPTSGWKTFSSKLFSWSIKYPSGYFMGTDSSESDFTKRGGTDVGIDYIGGDTYWANYDLNADTTPDKVPANAQTMALMVYKETDSMTIQQFVAKYQDISSTTNVKAGSVDGIQYTMTGNNGGKTSYNTNIVTVFKKGANFYVINYGKLDGLDATFLANYKTMLSSFQFTN